MENWDIRWKDYYKILQVHESAEQEVIKAAYDRLARKYHPDVSRIPTANARMKDINEAFEVLRDPDKRSRYHSLWLQKTGAGNTSREPNLTRGQRRGFPHWWLFFVCICAIVLAIVLIAVNQKQSPSYPNAKIENTSLPAYSDIKIKSITLPANAKISSGDLVYEQVFTVINFGSTDQRVYWEGSSSIAGIFDSGYVTVLKNESREVRRSYSYSVSGVEKVTYTLYYADIVIDTFSATHEIGK